MPCVWISIDSFQLVYVDHWYRFWKRATRIVVWCNASTMRTAGEELISVIEDFPRLENIHEKKEKRMENRLRNKRIVGWKNVQIWTNTKKLINLKRMKILEASNVSKYVARYLYRIYSNVGNYLNTYLPICIWYINIHKNFGITYIQICIYVSLYFFLNLF